MQIPRRADNALRWLIVTPWMHWVHHSQKPAETNSNYSTILSMWDRLFGSYRLRQNPDTIRFGLKEFPDTLRHQNLRGLLGTPQNTG